MTKYLWLDHIANHNMRNNWTADDGLIRFRKVSVEKLYDMVITSEKSHKQTAHNELDGDIEEYEWVGFVWLFLFVLRTVQTS